MNSATLRKVWEGLGFRTRLTFCLSGVFAIILAVGYWSLFLEFQEEIQSEFDRSLYNYATDLLQSLELNSGGKADLPFEVIFSADKIFPFPHGDALVKIYRKPFTELFSFTTDKDAPKNLITVNHHALLNETNVFLDLNAASGDAWRGILMQVDDAPVSDIYFFVAVPRQSLTNQENKFRSIFIAGQLIILIISAFMISVLAKSLLKSLETLTHNIREMPINNPDFKFEVSPGPPEITILAKILNQLLARIQQSLLAHQEFVAQAAHQLKTPLTIAKGHLEQLALVHHPETNSNLKVALEEIDMLSSTITNLLNLVQIESGFQNFNSVEVDLLDHVMSEVDRLDYLARKKGLKFQIKCIDQNPNQPEWCIKTDPQLLSIIFGNLLENSIKYAYESPIEIKLESTENLFVIAISNQTDPKTDPMISPNLRDKFIRGNTPEPGQGLGLYIAYKIASILNINLSLENLGSAFIVKLEIPNLKPKITIF